MLHDLPTEDHNTEDPASVPASSTPTSRQIFRKFDQCRQTSFGMLKGKANEISCHISLEYLLPPWDTAPSPKSG
jgi:hypothetical protein